MTIPPILRYEFITIARSSRTYLVRGIYLAILLIGLTMASTAGDKTVDLFAADRAREFFAGIWRLEVAILFVVVPVIVVSAITREKERDTLGLLMMSGLNGFQIIVGKVAGRLMFTVFLLLAGVPVLIAMQALGGITVTDLVAMHIGLLAAATLQAGIAVLCASVARTMAEGVGMAVLAMMGVTVFHGMFLLAPGTMMGGDGGAFFGSVVVQATFPLRTLPLVRPGVALAATIGALIWCTGVAAICIVIASRKLRLSQRQGSIQFLQKVHDGFDKLVTGGSDKLRIVAMHRRVGRNPILWREAHKQALAHTGLQIRIFYLLLIPCVLIVGLAYFDNRSRDFWLPFITTTYTAAMLFVVPIACFSFASERSRGRFAVLLTTPMPSRNIVIAKWWGATKSAGGLLGLTFCGLVMLGHEVSWLHAVYYLAVLTVFMLLVVLDGLTGSLKASSAPRAMTVGICGLAAEAVLVVVIANVVKQLALGGISAFAFTYSDPTAWITFIRQLGRLDSIRPEYLDLIPACLVVLVLIAYLGIRVWYFLLRYERWLLSDFD